MQRIELNRRGAAGTVRLTGICGKATATREPSAGRKDYQWRMDEVIAPFVRPSLQCDISASVGQTWLANQFRENIVECGSEQIFVVELVVVPGKVGAQLFVDGG